MKSLVTYRDPRFVLSTNVIFMIWNARQHYSPEALAQRALNRVRYFDSKYPAPKIITPGDREWPN